MKKKTRILLGITLILLTISAAYLSVKALKSVRDTNKNNIALAEISTNPKNRLYELEESLKDTFGDNYKTKVTNNTNATKKSENIELKFRIANSQEILYPDNYGGTYINENDELVIQLVRNEKNINSLKYNSSSGEISLDDSVIKEYVEHSYNDLNDINDLITKYFLKNGVKNTNFVANYVDVFSNKVIVELKNISLEEQEKFKNEVIDSDLIEFKLGERISTTATYKAGSRYTYDAAFEKDGKTINKMNSSCSVGARAKRNGAVGYITAGHCFGYMDYTVTSSKINNGTYVTRSYSSSMDAAFVKLSSGNSLSNDLNDMGYQASFINTTGQNYFISGTMVGKDGYAGKFGSGIIGSLNYSVTDNDGYYHSGLVKANITTILGDSGGPVFTISTLTLKEGAPLIGIISVGGTNVLGFYEYNRIVTALGLTKY